MNSKILLQIFKNIKTVALNIAKIILNLIQLTFDLIIMLIY